ncbi:hypothetical protein Bhyg_07335 [Pseudolycoriella hygida]|uniref:Uncharacterized protein n=1 Tax=Pseudolycoriella hygida TaxID=35572 RepID=A0A9Q0S1W5_9DIPT|nr:hypothetical protein Bhyg_07335 [Pseudolycoriella hygida]
MAVLQYSVVLALCFLSLTSCAPSPLFFGHKHQHVVVHVPYNIHTIHHHHVEKIPIYKPVPIIKHIPVYKEVHVPIVKEVHVPVHVPEYKGWSSSGWW